MVKKHAFVYPHTVENKPTPPVLYRYRSLASDEHLNWVREIIIDSVLYFTSPSLFNDPFDCRCIFTRNSRLDDLRRWSICINRRLQPTLTAHERKRIAREQITAENKNDKQGLILQDVQCEVDKAGVVCLSSNRENVVMWSHYADSHAGLCLGFDTSAKPFGEAQPVFYSHAFPELRLTDARSKAGHNFIEPFILTKSKSWKYEEEWRIVHGIEGCGKKSFPSCSLLEVVFGMNMLDEHKKKVIMWLGERKGAVKVLQAKRGGGYELAFDEIAI